MVSLATAILIALTSSFDIFLVVEAGGNFRIGQIFVIILTILAIARTIQHSDVPTLGLLPLLGWLVVQVMFIPATAFWPKSVGYCFWLSLNICLIFSFVQLFSCNSRLLNRLLQWYLYSFGFIASFGLVQFTFPWLGLQAPLVTQWWVKDRIPRLNGFSYEPSYYAAYLLIGFVLCGSLRDAKFRLISQHKVKALRWLIGSSIVLSSSRLGITFLALDVLSRRTWKNPIQLLHAPIRLPAIAKASFLPALCTAILFAAIIFARLQPATAVLLLAGTGVYGAPAHSVVERATSFIDTLTVFAQHPLVGRSLGGVSFGIADLHGVTVRSFQDSKPYEGMAIFAEVLAASGVLGIIPFLVFIGTIIYKPFELARRSSPEYSILLRALTRSLIVELAVLQFNQNILRPYLWVHLAMLAAVYGAAKSELVRAHDSLNFRQHPELPG